MCNDFRGLTLVTALLLRLFSLGRSSLSGSGSRSRTRSSVSIGVSDAVLELLNLRPAILGSDGNTENVLVGVDNGVHDSRDGGVVSSQRDTGDGLDGVANSVQELLIGDVENVVVEGLALVVDLRDGHTVGEGRDAHHVKEGGLGGTDLSTSLDELEIGRDFNGTTSNLGGDTESLEERGLTGFHTGVTGGNPDITRSDGTSTGRSSDTVGKDLGTGVLEVGVGEDQTDVA